MRQDTLLIGMNRSSSFSGPIPMKPPGSAGKRYVPRTQSPSWRRLKPPARTCAVATLLAYFVFFIVTSAPVGTSKKRRWRVTTPTHGDEGGAVPHSMGPGPTVGAVDGDHHGGDRPLVAVYFTGQARTLNRTICSIERRLFDPLVRQGFAPVVFIVGESDGTEVRSSSDHPLT